MRALILVALAGCLDDFNHTPGTLPGEMTGQLRADVAQTDAKTVGTEQKGMLYSLRYGMGAFAQLSRFGTLAGVDTSFALGWLDGDNAEHLYADMRAGGTLQPFYGTIGPVALRLGGDFGVGYDRDQPYSYAGGRLGIGARSRQWMLDASYVRRFFDAPGNDPAHEERYAAFLSYRPGKRHQTAVQIGFEYVRGDQRELDAGGNEVLHDYMFPGRYDMISIMIGVGQGADPENSPTLLRD